MTSDIPTRIYRAIVERNKGFHEGLRKQREENEHFRHALQQIADLGPSARGTPFGDIMASIAEEALKGDRT